MEQTKNSILNNYKKTKPKSTQPILHITLPYHHQLSKPLKKTLTKYDIKTTSSSAPTLKSMLSSIKTPTPTLKTRHTIYEIPCKDCDDFYIGQTYRPLLTWIKEHEACYRLNNHTDNLTGNIKSAPAKHGHDKHHTLDWNNTKILTTASTRPQLNLLEHAAIQIRDTPLNRQLCGPRINPNWKPILSKISDGFEPRNSNIDKF